MQSQSRWLSPYETPATITDCSKIVKVRASSIHAGFSLKVLYVIRTTPNSRFVVSAVARNLANSLVFSYHSQ